MRWLVVLVALALTGCWSDSDQETTGSINMCAARLYSNYTPRNLEQCMNICKSCENGNTVTCSTSCKLKGAS